jgi:hydroxyethylthiazole kinase-like uncharacterized protein yjeF
VPVSRFILTAAEMRAAEQHAIDAGTSPETLMERAGAAAAEAIWRYAEPLPTLILCGPGNNGGDGYVIARHLKARGVHVRVAAPGEPRTEAAAWARSGWDGDVGTTAQAEAAPILVDALFGTGLARRLDDAAVSQLARLASQASVRIAVDLPSGVATDDGSILSPVPDYDLTIAFAALKPSHLLQPAARHMGRLVVADIGIEAESSLWEIGGPALRRPGPDDHKYSRGSVALVAGEMPGASALAAAAALRSGAGYVRLAADAVVTGVPHAVVQGRGGVDDPRIGALVIGPGLGRDSAAATLLETTLGRGHPLVLDADALFLLEGRLERLRTLAHVPILTPHAGEVEHLFGSTEGSKVEQARRAAERANAVVIFKGADTVVAAPDGRAAIAPPGSPYLASAGTGDVLAGIAGAMRARGLDAFEAACAAVWLHSRAAEELGPGLIADDLVAALGTQQ